jgi:hypothetical protein
MSLFTEEKLDDNGTWLMLVREKYSGGLVSGTFKVAEKVWCSYSEAEIDQASQ